MPTSFASPRYIGYAAIAALRSPKTSGNRGSFGNWSKPRGQLQIDFGRDPAGAPVGDLPRAVDRAEVPARGDVAGAQVELDAERLEDAAPDLIVERIVAEEPEVAGPAARRDARRDVADEAAGGLGGEQGEIGQVSRLELRASSVGSREPAEALARDEGDLGGVRDGER